MLPVTMISMPLGSTQGRGIRCRSFGLIAVMDFRFMVVWDIAALEEFVGSSKAAMNYGTSNPAPALLSLPKLPAELLLHSLPRAGASRRKR